MLNVWRSFLSGFRLRPVSGLEPAVRTRYFLVAGGVLATVIVEKIVWVLACAALMRMRAQAGRGGDHRETEITPSFGGSLIVSWCGMRGIVTLAAALALPGSSTGSEFPFRDLIVLTAFCVVLGTLVLQGLTLRPLLIALDVHDDDLVGREATLARTRAIQSALDTLADDTSRRRSGR